MVAAVGLCRTDIEVTHTIILGCSTRTIRAKKCKGGYSRGPEE